jgi:hypothetical protein
MSKNDFRPIDFKLYVDLFYERFKKHNGYSELSEDKLLLVVENYLKDVYEKECAFLYLKLDAELKSGGKIDQYYYEKEYAKIKNKVYQKYENLKYMGEDLNQD